METFFVPEYRSAVFKPLNGSVPFTICILEHEIHRWEAYYQAKFIQWGI